MTFSFNSKGLELLKEFEGCKLEAYKDLGGVWTIGWGHTGGVEEGAKITQCEADALLDKDLKTFCEGVSKLVTNRHISANQFSAMVCFAYNVGLGNFKFSTLLRCVNKNNVEGAAGEFLRWNKVKGIVSAGLVRRRQREKELFTS